MYRTIINSNPAIYIKYLILTMGGKKKAKPQNKEIKDPVKLKVLIPRDINRRNWETKHLKQATTKRLLSSTQKQLK